MIDTRPHVLARVIGEVEQPAMISIMTAVAARYRKLVTGTHTHLHGFIRSPKSFESLALDISTQSKTRKSIGRPSILETAMGLPLIQMER